MRQGFRTTTRLSSLATTHGSASIWKRVGIAP
jgi:hypothetical protein